MDMTIVLLGGYYLIAAISFAVLIRMDVYRGTDGPLTKRQMMGIFLMSPFGLFIQGAVRFVRCVSIAKHILIVLLVVVGSAALLTLVGLASQTGWLVMWQILREHPEARNVLLETFRNMLEVSGLVVGAVWFIASVLVFGVYVGDRFVVRVHLPLTQKQQLFYVGICLLGGGIIAYYIVMFFAYKVVPFVLLGNFLVALGLSLGVIRSKSLP